MKKFSVGCLIVIGVPILIGFISKNFPTFSSYATIICLCCLMIGLAIWGIARGWAVYEKLGKTDNFEEEKQYNLLKNYKPQKLQWYQDNGFKINTQKDLDQICDTLVRTKIERFFELGQRIQILVFLVLFLLIPLVYCFKNDGYAFLSY